MRYFYLIYDSQGEIQEGGSCGLEHKQSVIDNLDGKEILWFNSPPPNHSKLKVVDGVLVEKDQPAQLNYAYARFKTYNINEQLGMLYDDIDAGLFGAKAKTGKFYEYIKTVKQQYPKPE